MTVNEFALRHEASRAEAGGAVTLRAGQDVVLVGADVLGGGDVTVDAGGAVIVQSVQDRDDSAFTLSIKSGGLFGTEVEIEEHSTHTEVARSALKAGGALTVIARGGDITLDAAELASGGQTELRADTGQVALLTETEIDYEQKKESDDSLLWFSTSDKGHHDETTVHVQIQASGGLTITTQDGVVVEYREAGSLDESLAQLAGTPGLDWLEELRGRDDVNWQAIQEAHEAWDHKAQGLSGVASALIAIALAVVTYGAGFEFALAQMGTTTAAATTTQLAVAVAIDAGFTSLVTQASLSLINNQGDLAAVFQELGSLDTLTSLATSMAAAGLTYGALDQLGLAGTQTGLLAKMERTLVRATTRAGVQTALRGGNLGDNLVASLKTAGIAAVGAELSGVIGAKYRQAARDGIDPLEYGLQKVVHAALGCGMAAAGGGNCGAGAAAGAVSAVTTDALYNSAAKKAAELNRLALGGKATTADALRTMVQWEQDGVDLGRLAGALGALVAGGREAVDINMGAEIGGNVAAHNFLETAWDLASLALAVAELGLAISDEESSKLDVALAGGAVVLDGMAALLPLIPGGAGVALHATKEGGKIVVKAITRDGKDISAALKTAAQARKGAQRTHVTQRTAAAVNAEHMAKGRQPPYKQGTRVTEYTTKGDEQFVRVHGTDNKARPWMMRKEAVDGLTAKQIQRKYSLPSTPTRISDVHVPAGTRIRTGKVESNFGGQGGATQYEWLNTEVPNTAIKNTRPLD